MPGPTYLQSSNHTENVCQSRRQTVQNVQHAVSTSNTCMDLVASDFLKEKVSESPHDTVHLRSSTGGHQLPVSLGKPGVTSLQPITVQQAKVIQLEANLSDRQMGRVMKNLRLQFGRKIVEPGLRETLTEDKKKFNQFFNADLVQFKDNGG